MLWRHKAAAVVAGGGRPASANQSLR
jgi:hypothetical protein